MIVAVDEEPFDAGGEGRVYHAAVGTLRQCVKAVPNVSPGELSTVADDLGRLVQQIHRAIAKSPARVVRTTLEGLATRLPTHLASHRLDGDDRWLLFLRSLQAGESLQAACNGESMPPRHVRFQLARQLIGYLTALQLYGCVHLDPYPDNVFVQLTTGRPVLSLIDLEYLGVTATTRDGRIDWSEDRFVRSPKSFGKPDKWLLPPWYPKPDATDRRPIGGLFVAAATWQALAVTFYTLTWGTAPFSWLTADSFRRLAQLSEATDIAAVLGDHDPVAERLIAERLGNHELYRSMVSWFSNGFIKRGSGPLPPLKELQDLISQLTLKGERQNTVDDPSSDDLHDGEESW